MNKLINIFDKVNKTNLKEHYMFENRTSYHENLMELFNNELNENDDPNKRDIVLDLIKNNVFDNDPQNFYDSLNKSKHKQMLTDYSISDLSKMKLFKVVGYNIGFALKKFEDKGYSEIVAVHNNEPDVKNIGKELMNAAINNRGCYLDHFDGFLSNLYEPMGFVEYKRDSYNPQYDKSGEFKQKYGEQDVIYRVHKNCLN
jgi:hypothetical protein